VKTSPSLRRAVGLFLLWKLVVVAVILLAYRTIPLDCDMGRCELTPYRSLSLDAFMQWDATNYCRLATQGYAAAPPETKAFYPLLPLLIQGLGLFSLDCAAAGLLLTTIFSLLFVLLLYALCRELHSDEAAWSSTLLCLSFPTAFFMASVYTEPLFLFLLFLFVYLYKLRPSRACYIPALLMPLVKPQAFFVLGFVAVDVLLAALRARQPSEGKTGRRGLLQEAKIGIGSMVFMAAGIALLLLFYQYATGDPLAAFKAQARFAAGNSIGNLVDLPRFLSQYFSASQHVFSAVNSLFDKLMIAAGFLLIVPLALTRPRWPLIAYVLLVAPPALMGNGMGYSRYFLLAFPFFAVAVGPWLAARPRFTASAVFVLAGLQMFLAARFALGLWVG
jgi:hypothetical protein